MLIFREEAAATAQRGNGRFSLPNKSSGSASFGGGGGQVFRGAEGAPNFLLPTMKKKNLKFF